MEATNRGSVRSSAGCGVVVVFSGMPTPALLEEVLLH